MNDKKTFQEIPRQSKIDSLTQVGSALLDCPFQYMPPIHIYQMLIHVAVPSACLEQSENKRNRLYYEKKKGEEEEEEEEDPGLNPTYL